MKRWRDAASERAIDLENPSKRGELIRAQLEIGHFLNA